VIVRPKNKISKTIKATPSFIHLIEASMRWSSRGVYVMNVEMLRLIVFVKYLSYKDVEFFVVHR
jgi:hypothetical protein